MKPPVAALILSLILLCGCGDIASGPTPETVGDAEAQRASSSPNIVWILLDACRAGNLGCYGYERRTSPNIDALAARGIVFPNAFSQANMTTWSVPSYMTGRLFPVYCLDRGSWRAMFRQRPENERYISELLAASGYHTLGISTHGWFSPNSRIWQAFDEFYYLRPDQGRAYAEFEQINQAFFEWLDNGPPEPFFVYIHSLDTHFPHRLRPPFDRWIDKDYEKRRLLDATLRRPPFSKDEKEHLRGLHDGSIAYADHHTGLLLERMAEADLADNTIFVIAADHGDLLGEDGKTFDHPSGITSYELFHVPLIMAGPGIPAGTRVEAVVQNMDITPTLLDILDIDSGAAMDGTSLTPLFADPSSGPLYPYALAKRPLGNDDTPPVLMARDAEFHFEWLPGTDAGHLYKMPDRLADRTDVKSEFPGKAAQMQAYLEDQVVPLWQDYAALPRTAETVVTIKLQAPAEPEDAWGENSTLDDGKWRLVSGHLKSCAFREDAPPVTFDLDVPNGEFTVQLEADSMIGRSQNQGSAFTVRLEPDGPVLDVATDDPSARSQFLDIGRFKVDNNSFRITLDEGDRRKWAVAKSVRFIPIGDKTIEDQVERDEQLRALGYLGD